MGVLKTEDSNPTVRVVPTFLLIMPYFVQRVDSLRYTPQRSEEYHS